MRSKRIQWLDFAKGLSILFVIIMHSMDNVIYSNKITYALIIKDILSIFAMPLFFSISGYLYKPTNTVHKFILMIYKKSTSFIIPYIIFACLSIFIHLNGGYNPLTCIILPLSYLWFLYSLFFIFIIFGVMDLLKLNLKTQVVISIICLFMSFFTREHPLYPVINNPIKNIFGFMVFFELGIILKKLHLLKYLNKDRLIYSLVLLFVFLLFIHFTFVGARPDTNFVYYNDILSKIISIPLCFGLFMRLPHNLLFNYFDKYGKYTLVIYLMQSPIISLFYVHVLLRPFKYFCYNHSLIVVIFLVILTWYLCIFTCKLLKHPIINFLFYPRGYINKKLLHTKFGKWLLL